MKEPISVIDASEVLNVKKSTVQKMIERGTIKTARKLSDYMYYIDADEVRSLKEERQRNAINKHKIEEFKYEFRQHA